MAVNILVYPHFLDGVIILFEDRIGRKYGDRAKAWIYVFL
jgi:hypothetical protein